MFNRHHHRGLPVGGCCGGRIPTTAMRKAHETGKEFAPSVNLDFSQLDDGRWVGSVFIGELYYESDPYQDKRKAAAEVLGYIQQIGAEIINEMQTLRNILEQ